jgi:hypothetical protein
MRRIDWYMGCGVYVLKQKSYAREQKCRNLTNDFSTHLQPRRVSGYVELLCSCCGLWANLGSYPWQLFKVAHEIASCGTKCAIFGIFKVAWLDNWDFGVGLGWYLAPGGFRAWGVRKWCRNLKMSTYKISKYRKMAFFDEIKWKWIWKSRNRGQNRIFLLGKITKNLTYFLYFYLFNLNSFGKSIISCTGFLGAVDA